MRRIPYGGNRVEGGVEPGCKGVERLQMPLNHCFARLDLLLHFCQFSGIYDVFVCKRCISWNREQLPELSGDLFAFLVRKSLELLLNALVDCSIHLMTLTQEFG